MSRVAVIFLLLAGALVGCGSEPPSLGPVREAVADADVVLVLGDSTGNDEGEWVELWARDITEVRTVTYHYWNPDLEQFPPAVEMGGDGPALDVWNLAKGGERADYPREFLGEVGQEPDVVLYSFGHNHTAENIGPGLLGTMEVVEERWGDVPAAWLTQNPSTTDLRERQAATMGALRDLSEDEGVPIIDVYSKLPDDRAEMDALLLDGTHPNDAGSRAWVGAFREILAFP